MILIILFEFIYDRPFWGCLGIEDGLNNSFPLPPSVTKVCWYIPP